MTITITQQAFLLLVKVGLWGNGNTDIRIDGTTDWQEVYRLATEQSVLGLVLAGLEHSDIKPPKELLLQWIGEVQMLEQQNQAMNLFIAELIKRLRNAGIYTLLVKGQGIAQCYERPLWRSYGDVDLLLSESCYKMAKDYLLPLASDIMSEERYSKHLGMNIEQWYVEIHGTLRTGLSGRTDRVVDDVQKDVFYGGNVRSWNNGNTQIFLPSPDNDVFFVFTHFIKHFYKEGMSLRQICDWCRLLWTYKDSLDHGLLEKRIRKAGLMSEWKTFAALAVEYLGMPDDAMPFYDSRFTDKGSRLVEFILGGYSGNQMKDTLLIAKIFPWKAISYSPSIFLNVNWLKVKERIFKR